ncbi:hypothetical protein PHYPSEUDO_014325 [Phytophthora pseudosyringae]|uniref:Dolichol-phosphate mannosyltransferase subunit 3 n=1 Tax=Phytophthora pseudosyringae TaxID=221518 RepID=A0A8T1WK35_9STRA|nr:hypothetical protein PHYPSEUDO_014325 [Phytophthora pseudosyringae]
MKAEASGRGWRLAMGGGRAAEVSSRMETIPTIYFGQQASQRIRGREAEFWSLLLDIPSRKEYTAVPRFDHIEKAIAMLKYQKWLAAFVVLLALWLLLLRYAADPEQNPRILQVVTALPMYALVSFGAYSLAVIALSVMAVQDFPEAAKELDRQVMEAKADLTKKGFKF